MQALFAVERKLDTAKWMVFHIGVKWMEGHMSIWRQIRLIFLEAGLMLPMSSVTSCCIDI
ncbi:hypothetical protein JF55_06455 [Pseudomonas sp. 1-7]|nr:hypothetical protein JF55_06455 [Pseudomonas sp. 1-7]